ncbi:MAG: Bax inhibitor-1/YccA family protein [Verrucomicrobiota bacterium]
MFEANPTIKRLGHEGVVTNPLSYNGVIHRTGVLLLVTAVTFGLTWRGLQSGELSPAYGLGGAIAGLVLALIIIFTRTTNPLLIGAYAITQGVSLGVISYFASQRYPGIALQAVSGTFSCFLAVLWLYSIKVLRATPTFVKVISGAILGIMALYLVDIVAGLFGHPLEIVRGNSGISIGITAIIIIVASLSFVIDFAAIDEAVAQGIDSRYGWRLAFSLLVGLVWLYIEMLRLLSKLRSR